MFFHHIGSGYAFYRKETTLLESKAGEILLMPNIGTVND